MVAQAQCPSCGSPVEFSIGNSLVAVCASCQSLVGRGDGGLETYGKVAELAPTRSPLRVGLKGRHKGVVFEITGRTQMQHSAGGTWNEWYVAFRGGKRWGWLAEAQGRYSLTFRQEGLGENLGDAIDSVDDLDIGDEVAIPRAGRMTVIEIDEATVKSAEGELPFVPVIGETVAYVDLQGSGQKCATIDYSESPPAVFGGRDVTLEQMGLADKPEVIAKLDAISAATVNCPSCAAPLTIQVPDEAQRIACQFCGALHDATGGKLRFLEELGKPERQPLIPLGSTGRLLGTEYTVIGFVRRSMEYAGQTYRWSEYLLWARGLPYSWLVHSEGHWNLGAAVSAGAVEDHWLGALTVSLDGLSYRKFDAYRATVDVVVGEFYWKVHKGETVAVVDYVKPPWMLTREESRTQPADDTEVVGAFTPPRAEVNFTLAEYVPAEQIGEAFADVDPRVPGAWDVAPNRPYPGKVVYGSWGLIALLATLLAILFNFGGYKHVGDWYVVLMLLISAFPFCVLMAHWGYEKQRWDESDYCPAWLQSSEE